MPKILRTMTIVIGAGVSAAPLWADTQPFRLELCADSRTRGWSFYCRPPLPEPEPAPIEPEPVAAPALVPQHAMPEPEHEFEQGPATQEMMAFRALVDELRFRAVLDPTPENVQAFMEINKLMADRAGAFTDQWQRILYATPHLDANVDYPLAEAGVGVYQDQLREARTSALRRVAATQGILFVFEDSTRCGICAVQGAVLNEMQSMYGVSVLAVSRDGGANEAFPEALVDQGRLAELGLADYPSPTLALLNPGTNEVQVIGSGLLTTDQILERIYVITEIPAGERFRGPNDQNRAGQ